MGVMVRHALEHLFIVESPVLASSRCLSGLGAAEKPLDRIRCSGLSSRVTGTEGTGADARIFQPDPATTAFRRCEDGPWLSGASCPAQAPNGSIPIGPMHPIAGGMHRRTAVEVVLQFAAARLAQRSSSAFAEIAQSEVHAVMKRVLWSSPPKARFAGLSGTRIFPMSSPPAEEKCTPSPAPALCRTVKNQPDQRRTSTAKRERVANLRRAARAAVERAQPRSAPAR